MMIGFVTKDGKKTRDVSGWGMVLLLGELEEHDEMVYVMVEKWK